MLVKISGLHYSILIVRQSCESKKHTELSENSENELVSKIDALDDTEKEIIISKLLKELTRKEEIHPIIKAFAMQEYYSGPIPNAVELSKYEKIEKGFASRIITMAEEQSKHRRNIEEILIKQGLTIENSGMLFAFILSVLFLGVTLVLALTGNEIVAYITGGTGGFGLIGSMVSYLSEKIKNQKEEKQKE